MCVAFCALFLIMEHAGSYISKSNIFPFILMTFFFSAEQQFDGGVKPKLNLNQIAITQVWRYQDIGLHGLFGHI